MVDITTITTAQLERDLQDSRSDISVCEDALTAGIEKYSGGSVKERLEANKHFVKVITEELNRRLNLSTVSITG